MKKKDVFQKGVFCGRIFYNNLPTAVGKRRTVSLFSRCGKADTVRRVPTIVSTGDGSSSFIFHLILNTTKKGGIIYENNHTHSYPY